MFVSVKKGLNMMQTGFENAEYNTMTSNCVILGVFKTRLLIWYFTNKLWQTTSSNYHMFDVFSTGLHYWCLKPRLTDCIISDPVATVITTYVIRKTNRCNIFSVFSTLLFIMQLVLIVTCSVFPLPDCIIDVLLDEVLKRIIC